MTVQSSQIHVGIPNFTDPTLLLIGDAEALRWLSGEISARRAIVLGQQSGANRATLRIVPAKSKADFSRNENAFTWPISAEEAEQVALQLSALADSQRPAHAYIDPVVNPGGVQIMVSMGEYDPSRVF
jgi:hypothetical protein